MVFESNYTSQVIRTWKWIEGFSILLSIFFVLVLKRQYFLFVWLFLQEIKLIKSNLCLSIARLNVISSNLKCFLSIPSMGLLLWVEMCSSLITSILLWMQVKYTFCWMRMLQSMVYLYSWVSKGRISLMKIFLIDPSSKLYTLMNSIKSFLQ